jgi:hypothetical protein
MATTFDVEQLLIKESGRIGPDIYRRTVDTSPWLKLVKQDAWPDEMGDSVSVLVYERSLPYKSDGTPKVSWANLSSNPAYGTPGTGSGSCAPSAETIEFGQTLRTYNLQQTALNSPDICLNDLRVPLKRKEQLANIMAILTDATSEVWKERYRDEYVRLSDHKVIARPNLEEVSTGAFLGTGAAGNSPTSKLTQGILDRIYMKLIRDGAGNNVYDRSNGAPVFLAIMSSEASDDLIRSNADIRQDFRWSDRVNELLAPLGVNRTYRGFHHLVDPYAPRWDLVAGSYVRRYPFIRSAAGTQGYKYDINPAYETAEFEDTILFHQDVFTSLIPKPISGTGAMNFDPHSFRGDFTWRNIPDRDNNPDGAIGFFRAVFGSGSKPVFPQYGYVIRHSRCNNDLNLVGCYS